MSPPEHLSKNPKLCCALSFLGDPCPAIYLGLPWTPVSLWRSLILPGSLLPALSPSLGSRLCLQLISACLHELGPPITVEWLLPPVSACSDESPSHRCEFPSG